MSTTKPTAPAPTPREKQIISPPPPDLTPALYPAKESAEFRVHASIARMTVAATGELHRVLVPRKATVRSLWLAFGPLNQATVAPWYLAGRLVFYLGGRKVTEFPLAAGLGQIITGALQAPGMVVGSSAQPAISVAGKETYANQVCTAQLPCYTFNVECDTIALEVDKASLGGTTLNLTNAWEVSQGSRTYATASPNYFNGAARLYLQLGGTTAYDNPATGQFYYDSNLAYSPALGLNAAIAVPLLRNNALAWGIDPANKPSLLFDPNGLAQSGSAPAPTFDYGCDGIAEMLTGFSVLSQYPGGL